jgi:hypothetical protein
MPLKFPRVRYPLNWGFTSKGLAGVRRAAVFHAPLNFYDPVFVGTISTNTALDSTINTTCDITFAPFQNMADLLNQTALVASSTTSNDYGYRPYIVQLDGYEPLLVDVSASITANTTKLVIRANSYLVSGTPTSTFGLGITNLLSANELTGKKCYVRQVLCPFDLTTRPSQITLDSGSLTGNNSISSADTIYATNSIDSTQWLSVFLRGDGVTWRKSGSTANYGNTPIIFFNSFEALNAFKISINKNIAFP